MTGARCVWEVTGGLIPGEPAHEYTRRFGLTSEQWQGGRAGLEQFLKFEAEAAAYARHLQILCTVGRAVKWTRIDFRWY